MILQRYHNLILHIDGSAQERRNSSALAMELHLSCTNPLIYNSETMTNTRHRSDLKLTKDTPYLVQMDKLWSVFCEYFREKNIVS